MSAQWFEVDKEGLAKLLKRRGMQYVLFELLQNAWDSDATCCDVTLTPVEGRPLVELCIVDDSPTGFKNLAHAYTLFAESSRKGDPTKRGRFNLGEKLVLAACETARIVSTTGSVVFEAGGARATARQKRASGTEFTATIRMTRDELAEVLAAARTVIAPIPTTVNGETLAVRKPLHVFKACLATEQADEEGYLRRTVRYTDVRVYARLEGEPSRLYEMGIPVVDTDDAFDVEVMQKIPLSAERDNVTPAYLRDVRVAVLNAMHARLSAEDAARPSVADALGDSHVTGAAVKAVLDAQYGTKRAVFDPSDPEANRRLVAEGYNVIHGGAFSSEAWANIRAHGAALPSGQIRPTPKPYSDDPNAPLRKLLPREEWTDGMKNMEGWAVEVSRCLLGFDVAVVIDRGHATDGWSACYGSRELTFNLARLGRRFFDEGPSERVNELLIHEFAHHHASGNHLDEDYYKASQRFGAKLTAFALKSPWVFERYGWRANAAVA